MFSFLAVLYNFSVIQNVFVHNFKCLPDTERSLKVLQETSGGYFSPCLSLIFTGYHKPPDNANSMALTRRLLSHFHYICAITSLAGLYVLFLIHIYFLLACLLQIKNHRLPD